jgi:putative ABC transport system permease protein
MLLDHRNKDHPNKNIMLATYIKTAWRNLLSRKTYTLINILGLSVGIASSLIIFLVIHYELSYDRFNSKKDRICRVVSTFSNYSNNEITRRMGSVPVVLPSALRLDFPQVEKVAAMWNIGGAQIHIPIPGNNNADEKKLKENTGLYFVEPQLFDIFDYSWLAGNASRLKEPNTVVLSQSLAREFFGDWKIAMGRTIQMWSFRVPLQVVGVYKDLPENSDIEVKMGASYATFRNIAAQMFAENNWNQHPWPSECFLLLPQNETAGQFSPALASFVKKYYPGKQDAQQQKVTLAFQPLSDIHLNENFSNYKNDALSHKELWSLGLIGFFLLLVACINFINLATAQSVTRAKEIGVRKVLGSNRGQILKQFLHETAIVTTIAVLLGCLLAKTALPFVANLMRKPLSLDLIAYPSILLFLLVLGLTVNFLAGFYPGIVLSGFSPIEAIKNKISSKTVGGISLRRGLVVFQFVIAQFLVLGTIVVIEQMNFFRNQPLGFEKNAVALIELPSDSLDQTRYGYLKTEMLKIPGVVASSLCLDGPASGNSNFTNFYFDNNPVLKDFPVNLQFGDSSYLNTFQIALAAGRAPYPSDTARELLVNETLVRKLGLSSANQILGRFLSFDGQTKLSIVGVMKDFNSKSLKEAVSPFVLASNVHAYNYIALKLNPASMRTTLEDVQNTFTQLYPTYIYDLSFLNETIAHFYAGEEMISQLFKITAFLAIFISCLGLYGLVSFMATQKTKEVGIRKVLGASIQSIVFLFSKEFTILIAVAFLITAPLGYFFMHQWLSGFYYHIGISWTLFILVIGVSFITAWITVGYKAIKAAVANPVKSLRSE